MRQLRVRLKHLHILPSRMQVVEPRIPHRPVPMHLRAPRLRPRRRHHFAQRVLEGALFSIQHQESTKYVEFHRALQMSAFYAASCPWLVASAPRPILFPEWPKPSSTAKAIRSVRRGKSYRFSMLALATHLQEKG